MNRIKILIALICLLQNSCGNKNRELDKSVFAIAPREVEEYESIVMLIETNSSSPVSPKLIEFEKFFYISEVIGLQDIDKETKVWRLRPKVTGQINIDSKFFDCDKSFANKHLSSLKLNILPSSPNPQGTNKLSSDNNPPH
jgi:hypothetical protein